ncbi:MAG: transposase [Arcticibacterium sp.]
MIPENHVVQSLIDKVDIDSLREKYKGVGRSSFHPNVMLKIITNGYLSIIYSSQKGSWQLLQTLILCS